MIVIKCDEINNHVLFAQMMLGAPSDLNKRLLLLQTQFGKFK